MGPIEQLPPFLFFREPDLFPMFYAWGYTDGRLRGAVLDLATVIWLNYGVATRVCALWSADNEPSGHSVIPCRAVVIELARITDEIRSFFAAYFDSCYGSSQQYRLTAIDGRLGPYRVEIRLKTTQPDRFTVDSIAQYLQETKSKLYSL